MSRRQITLTDLLVRGDVIAVENGRLSISAKSGKAVPTDWMANNESELIRQILVLTHMKGFRITRHTTGNYEITRDKDRIPRASGVTLHFVDLVTGESPCAIFNAETKRKRTTKHGRTGDPLPKGQFRVQPNHSFVRLWLRTGLRLPKLSAIHEYMGNLKGIVFTGYQCAKGRLDKNSLEPLSISYQDILAASRIAVFPDKRRITDGEHTDNSPIRTTDKQSAENQYRQGIQPKSATCPNYYGKRIQGSADQALSFDTTHSIPAQEQSNEEWVADYDSTDPL